MSDKEIVYNQKCFVTGQDNPLGLKVDFTDLGNNEIEGIFTPSEHHQGYPDHLHGGLAATLLDAAMARAVNSLGLYGMTARMELRYRERIPVGSQIKIKAKVLQQRRSIIDLESYILLPDGKKAVEASARFMQVG